MLIALARLLLVAYLPGALLYRVPRVNRARREALPAEERAFWAVTLSVTISLVATLLLAVAGQYSFGRLLLADLVIAVAPVAVYRRRLLLTEAAHARSIAAPCRRWRSSRWASGCSFRPRSM